MIKEKTPYNPTPGDYNTQILSGTRPEDPDNENIIHKHESHSKVYSHKTHVMDGQGNDLNSSKPKTVAGSIAMNNNNNLFEYKE